MNRIFGTDGIRAEIGHPKMAPTFVLRLGWAFGMVLNQRNIDGPVLVAKDTRLSGYMLESALESGLSASGRDIKLVGPLPTPGVAFLVQQIQGAGAIVISASHNAFNHNGLKFFGQMGDKLDRQFQEEVEQWMRKDFYCSDTSQLGRARRIVDAVERYVDHLVSAQQSVFNLSQMRLIFDGANGAAYRVGPILLRRLQADLRQVSCRPNGLNINRKCGSTDIANLRREVLKHGAHYGIATDGDADRLYMVDQHGEVYDGDKLLYALFISLLQRKEMTGGVVGTIQSNQGLQNVIVEHGFPFERTRVGDRFISEYLHKKDWIIGGEPSGHLIHRGMFKCSDGLLIAVHLLGFLKESGQTLAEITEDLRIIPGLQINHPARWPGSELELLEQPSLKACLDDIDERKHRVIVRPSGTEAVVRILVEGEEESENKKIAGRIDKIIGDLIKPDSVNQR